MFLINNIVKPKISQKMKTKLLLWLWFLCLGGTGLTFGQSVQVSGTVFG